MSITVSKRDNRKLFDGLAFVCRIPSHQLNGWPDVIRVKSGCVCRTDGHRLYFVNEMTIEDGFYQVEKFKSSFTLETRQNINYPPVDAVIPKKFRHSVQVNKEAFRHALNQMKIMATRDYCTLDLVFSKKLKMKIGHPSIGLAETEVILDKPVTPSFETMINIRYLLDAIIGLKEKAVTIGLQENGEQAIMFEDGLHKALIMPCR